MKYPTKQNEKIYNVYRKIHINHSPDIISIINERAREMQCIYSYCVDDEKPYCLQYCTCTHVMTVSQHSTRLYYLRLICVPTTIRFTEWQRRVWKCDLELGHVRCEGNGSKRNSGGGGGTLKKWRTGEALQSQKRGVVG